LREASLGDRNGLSRAGVNLKSPGKARCGWRRSHPGHIAGLCDDFFVTRRIFPLAYNPQIPQQNQPQQNQQGQNQQGQNQQGQNQAGGQQQQQPGQHGNPKQQQGDQQKRGQQQQDAGKRQQESDPRQQKQNLDD
jgi:hypothetical protein